MRGSALLAVGVALGLLAPRAEARDPDRGLELAVSWCAECHLVDAAGRGFDVAPPFVTLAKTVEEDPGWVRAWLIAPHPNMPDPGLSLREIDDIVAYLRTLER
jgi:mono/diheme cytochrome c family protein